MTTQLIDSSPKLTLNQERTVLLSISVTDLFNCITDVPVSPKNVFSSYGEMEGREA